MKTTSRILSIGMALLLWVCLCTVPAFAEDTGASSTPPVSNGGDSTTPPVTNTSGDGVYVTAATVTDLAGGEVTTVERDDHVNIVLRVVDHSSAKNNVTADQIVTRINSSVFQYTGTGEISQLIEGTDDGGDYYSYVLLFRDVIYAGGGNTLNIDLSYLDSSMAMQQFAVTIGQCVDKDPKTPNLVMRQSSYGTDAVTAGNPFTLSVTAYATDGDESLSDVIVSVTLPDGITLTGGSLSSYVGTMSAKSTRDVSFAVLPSASFTGGVANITVNMTGTGTESGTAVTGTGTISVPISQPDRFEITTMELSDTIYVGDTTSVTLNFVNKGKNPVANLEASISGENLGVDVSQQYIGNIAAGTENSVDFDLTPQQAGELSGTITLTYESSDGTTKTLTQDFSGTVQEMPVYDDPGMIDPGIVEPEPTGMPVWGWLLIVVGVVVVVVIVVAVVRKKKKAAALAKLEDGDEDL